MDIQTKFARSLEILLREEGGYVNDRHDPGGETFAGITRRDHPEAWAKGRPTSEQIEKIYREQYWEAIHGDDLPWPLCLFVFDCAVNQGVSAASKLLQRSLDTVQDGIIGVTTLRLAKASRQWHWARFMAFRALRYTGTRNFDRFGEGWLIRIIRVAMESK